MNKHYSHPRQPRDIDAEWANGHGLPLALVVVMVGVMALMMPDDLPFTVDSMDPASVSRDVDWDPIGALPAYPEG